VSKVAVYIATTDGPVRIERISPEIAPVSEVFIGRAYKPLVSMSRDYDEFVARGRPVAKAFGPFDHPGFRLDVSERIGDGQSWELAVFAAHGLENEARLANPDEMPSAVAWLTGRVDVDLNVGRVDHIAEKFHAARALFAEWTERGVPVTAYIPADGAAAPADTGVAVVRVSETAEVVGRLMLSTAGTSADVGISASIATVPAPKTEKHRKPSRRPARIAFAAIAGVGAIGVAGVAVSDPERAVRAWSKAMALVSPSPAAAPAAPAPKAAPKDKAAVAKKTSSFRIFARRAPTGRNCADVHLARADAFEFPLALERVGGVARIRLAGLCGIVLELPRSRDFPDASLRLRVVSGAYPGAERAPVYIDTAKGPYRWVQDLPRRLAAPATFRAVAVLGKAGRRDEIGRLARADDPATEAAAGRRDIAVSVLDYRIDP
jgi:hypothetical protein